MAEPFYSPGLRFSCTRCSACCRGEPGYVFLSREDLRRLLRRLRLDFAAFFRDYCRLVDAGQGNSLSLREVSRGRADNDCVFWSEKGCSVYEDRPIQCSTYPFWASILGSRSSWDGEAESCPGIGTGELRPREYIEERLLAQRSAGTILLAYDFDPECADEDTILGGAGLGPDAPDALEGEE